jgi:hypothetical protein
MKCQYSLCYLEFQDMLEATDLLVAQTRIIMDEIWVELDPGSLFAACGSCSIKLTHEYNFTVVPEELATAWFIYNY